MRPRIGIGHRGPLGTWVGLSFLLRGSMFGGIWSVLLWLIVLGVAVEYWYVTLGLVAVTIVLNVLVHRRP